MNKLMGVDLKKLALIDASKLVDSIGNLNCTIQFERHSYISTAGGEYKISRICISSSAEDLQRLALVLLTCTIGTQCEAYLPIAAGDPTKGIKIGTGRPSEYSSFHRPKSFTYTPKRRLKRYPWYPWSSTCDAQTELPVFTLAGMPGETACPRLRDGRRDLREPHMVCIGGHPKALIRLARLLLDYSDANIPSDIDIVLEPDGGLRGVGPLSYEARFERVDPCRCAACVGDSS
ncbi:hypothetical protein D5045_15005 [Verminephrobacter eiseniae]|uniref:hypothetical protein n=1 Tax=Verminephrobacter eiseniae TaxID=364317 RepID=UPI002237BBC7|nr:hypothetical protein [Verminephrobacter eiseniae]MCW5261437.1 hypothetical protein [Verminephrobacter eiseniae]